jgi:hypothetical protein
MRENYYGRLSDQIERANAMNDTMSFSAKRIKPVPCKDVQCISKRHLLECVSIL